MSAAPELILRVQALRPEVIPHNESAAPLVMATPLAPPGVIPLRCGSIKDRFDAETSLELLFR